LVEFAPDASCVTAWRDYRSYSLKQRIGSDFLMNRGPFAARPVKTPTLLIGGAGGGGKSHFLRSMAFELCMELRDLGFPNPWGVLATDNYPNLRDRFINMFKKEFAGLGEIRETNDRGLHVAWFGEAMGGCYLRNLDASGGRRGAEFEFGLGDELTDWQRKQFEDFIYTLRSGRALPFHARGFASNPDGIGHGWVKELFVPEYRNLDDEYFQIVKPENFLYVPMLVTDNMLYDQIGDVILGNIAIQSDPNVRRARLTGDWNIYGSGRFPMWRSQFHLFTWPEFFAHYGIPEGSDPRDFVANSRREGFSVYSSLDYGTSLLSISAYLLHLVGPDGSVWTFAELAMSGMEARPQAAKILEFEKYWLGTERGQVQRPVLRYADPKIWGKSATEKEQSNLTRGLTTGLRAPARWRTCWG
jgi:hypothetical protein